MSCPKYLLFLGQKLHKKKIDSIEIQILDRIKKAGRGVLFFTESFVSYGSSEAVKKALQRLTNSGELDRVATGIYVRPVIDNVIGNVSSVLPNL